MSDPQQYITWVGSPTPVGPNLYVGWSPRAATDAGTVKAHDMGEWEQIDDAEAYAIATMSNVQSNGVMEMVSQRGGVVRYYEGGGHPPLAGYAVGDVARGRDANDNILVEYRWTGSAWEKVALTDGTISSLDVGKLVAGSATLQHVVARRIWSGVVESDAVIANKIKGAMIEAGAITAESGIIASLDIGRATAGYLSADRIAARSITGAKLAVGAITADSGIIASLDAGVIKTGSLSSAVVTVETLTGKTLTAGTIIGGSITGATLQTALSGRRVVLNSSGMTVYDDSGSRTMYTNSSGDMILAGNIDIRDSWTKLTVGDLVDPFNLFRWGAGLKWERLDGALRTPGGIGIVLDVTNNRTGVMLQCPSGNSQPQSLLTMFDDSVSLYARAGVGCSFDASAQRMFMNAGGGTYITGGYDATTGGRTLGVVKDSGHKMEMQISGNTIFFGNGVHSNGTLTATGTKTFVMPHPLRKGEALYHASTESPWDGVEYWGQTVLDDTGTAVVDLPEYVEPIRRDDTPVSITATGRTGAVWVPRREGGRSFTVCGTPGDTVDWLWKGARNVPGGNTQPEGLDLPDFMDFPEEE